MYCRHFQAHLSKAELATATTSRNTGSPDASEALFLSYTIEVEKKKKDIIADISLK